MTTHLRIPLAALLLLGASLLSVAPTAAAHNCITSTYGSDPADCDGHDCTSPDDEAHLWHIVYHMGDNARIHGCGILLHVGVDGQGGGYVCLPAMRCIQWTADGSDLLA